MPQPHEDRPKPDPATPDAAAPGPWDWKPYRSKHRQANDQAVHADDELLPDDDVPVIPGCPANHPSLITEMEVLVTAVAGLRQAGRFAFDTEFIGEDAYLPRVCVIQCATAERVDLIDPLADGLDTASVWEILADASVLKVVHAGQQDLAPVARRIGKAPVHVVDTQLLAAFSGLGYSTSLDAVTQETLGVTLAKGPKFSQWDRRPLTEAQRRYAANDVRGLLAVYDALRERCESLGNTRWFEAAMAEWLETTATPDEPTDRKLKARGVGTMGRKRRGVVNALLHFREELARQFDAPPRSVIQDQVLVDLAYLEPSAMDELPQVKGLPRPVYAHHGEGILRAVQHGLKHPAPRQAKPLPRPTDAQRDVINEQDHLIRQELESRHIAPGAVFTKKQFSTLLMQSVHDREIATHPLRQGWRAELLGEAVDKAIRAMRSAEQA